MAIMTGHAVTLRDLLRTRAFAVLFPAEIVSVVGSQLARFALSVLVFDRTGSAAAAALTYATTFVPAALGGVLIGKLGDSYPRRTVMVVADLVRAALFLAMLVPAIPIAVLVVLVAVAVFIDPAFGAAEVSYLADALPDEAFRTSAGWRATADQAAQVLGFGFGGVLVVLVSARGALLIDALTFVVSAVVIFSLLDEPRGRHSRAAIARAATQMRQDEDRSGSGAGSSPPVTRFDGLWTDRRTRVHMAFTVLVGLFVLPEALAVSFGHQIGAGTAQTGVLLAMIPLGSAVGSVLIVRVPRGARGRLSAGMAITCGIPLLVSATDPGWVVASLCWLASGLLTAYQVEVISALVTAIPSEVRARLLGIVSAWLVGSQGVSFALGGALAAWLGPGRAIAVAGAVGSVLTSVVVLVWMRGHDRAGAVPAT